MTNQKSNSNDLITAIVVIGLILGIAGGGYFWLANKNLAPSVGPDPRKEAIKDSEN